MGVNKVEYYGETLIDTTGTTVSEDTLMEGETAINAAGEQIIGKLRAVEYKAQNPTAEEKAQARENIDALGTEELEDAVNTALTQAKESGEFDGRDGQDGQDGKDGSDGIGIETIQQVTISSADGAKNVWRMTLTNGQTADFVVENGAKGSDGKSAYEIAKAAGFTGTEEEFGDMLYNSISGLHEHRWNQIKDRPFGDFPTEEGTDTVTSDDVIYGKYHRVSEFIPTLADLQRGGTVSYYRMSGGTITGSLVTINFPQGDYTIAQSNNGLLINYDGVPMVIVSFNGKPQFGAITFPDITEPGVYFDQGKYRCVHSLKINNYDGFKFYEIKPIPKEYLPEDLGAVKTVNNIAPDANGNINIEVSGEGGGGSGKADSAFNLLKSNTLVWNGDTEGKAVAVSTADPSISYVHASNIIPTLAELQKGGSYWTTTDGTVEYEFPFTSEGITESGNLIIGHWNYFLVAKEDNVHYVNSTDSINCILPKAGIYFVSFGAEGYTCKLTITDYTGFATPILKMENLTPHGHDWYGKVVKGGNTARGDDVVHGGYVKVSDAVPTLEELRNGGLLRYYRVEDNKITGDLIAVNYLESPNDVYSMGDYLLIACDGVGMVQIKEDGVYFRQDQYDCIHSLTVNGYEGFEYNLEKIPAELLPENTGGGVSSWNDLTDKPFGEATTYSDTLTWDGDITGREYVEAVVNGANVRIVHISDTVPSNEEFAKGGQYILNGEAQTFTAADLLSSDRGGSIRYGTLFCVFYVREDNTPLGASGFSATFPKKGIYFATIPSMDYAVTGLSINDYTFVETEIKKIDQKYLPKPKADIVFTTSDFPFNSEVTVTCNQTFGQLQAMSIEELLGAISLYNNGDKSGIWRALTVERNVNTTFGMITFTFGGLNPGSDWQHYTIAMLSTGEIDIA